MNQVRETAYGKLNLGLDVTGVREDGYHLVDMIMQTVSVADTVEITSVDTEGDGKDRLYISYDTSEGNRPGEQLSEDQDNLCLKALRSMKEHCNLSGTYEIHLMKRIPIAAGMAGGSTDAAAVLRGMNRLENLGLSIEELCELGVKLGADVPYCIRGGTMRSQGIGEILTPVKGMPQCFILLGKPGISLSTPVIYKTYDEAKNISHPSMDVLIDSMKKDDLIGFCRAMGNVLEQAALPDHPQVGEISDFMEKEGALRAMMTGSGPTVFGIFNNEEKVNAAYEKLKESGLAQQSFVVRPVNRI